MRELGWLTLAHGTNDAGVRALAIYQKGTETGTISVLPNSGGERVVLVVIVL